MVTHPIRVARDSYHGSNSSRRAKAVEDNRIAETLEKHINQLLENQQQPVQQYRYSQIAAATQVPLETVARICFSIDGGHNGFTAIKAGMTVEQTEAAAKSQR